MSSKLCHEKTCSSYQPNLFHTTECLARVTRTALTTVQQHRNGEFRAVMYYDYTIIVREKTFQQCFQGFSALGTILHLDLQFTNGARNFISSERRFKTVTVVANLLPLLPNKMWPR